MQDDDDKELIDAINNEAKVDEAMGKTMKTLILMILLFAVFIGISYFFPSVLYLFSSKPAP